ncbi:hypothetical protein BGZ65_000061, partial [Modicella reniformis]
MSSAEIPEDTLSSQLTSNQIQAGIQQLVKNQEMLQIQHIQQQIIVKNQKEALDRLAIIHNHGQVLLTQTYELHEYPIPRLFIVLPKDPGLRGELNPFSEPF